MPEPGEHPDVVPYNLGDLADVSRATTPADGDLLRYNATSGEWAPHTRGTWQFTRTGGASLVDDTWAAAYTGWVRPSQVDNAGVNGGDGTFFVDEATTIRHTVPGTYSFCLSALVTGLDAGDVVRLLMTGDAFPPSVTTTLTVNAELEAWADANDGAWVHVSTTLAAYLDGENGDYPMPLYPDIIVHKIAAAHTVSVPAMSLHIATV